MNHFEAMCRRRNQVQVNMSEAQDRQYQGSQDDFNDNSDFVYQDNSGIDTGLLVYTAREQNPIERQERHVSNYPSK